jgi:MFS family permease
MGFALSVQIAALSWILSTQYGLKIDEIGLVWAAGPIAGILGQVVFGVVSDNVWFWGGRRRPFILIGGVLAALSMLALPNLGVISEAMGLDGVLGIAIAVALSLDISINVGFNPTRSIIADVTPEGDARIKGYTWMQTISGTLGVLAYFISVLFGNIDLIYIGAVIALLLSVIPPFFIEEPRSETEEVATSINLKQTLLDIRPLWGFLIYAVYGIASRLTDLSAIATFMIAFSAGVTAVTIAQTLLQKEAGKSKEEAGHIGFRKVLAAHSFTWIGIQSMFIYMFSYVQYRMPTLNDERMGQVVSWSFLILNAIAAILPAFVLEPMTRRLGRVRTHLMCIASMAVGYGLLWLGGATEAYIYLCMAILGVGWAATVSLPFAIMSQQVDKSKMGLYMGLFNLSVVLPQLVASLGVGQYLNATGDKSLVFLIAAGCLALSALAWSFVKEK